MSALCARGVTVRLGERALLRGVTLQVAPGERVALVGSNGAGKSTLCAVLAGLRTPTAGEVHLDGRPLAAWDSSALARRRAFLTQREHLEQPLGVREVVALGRWPHGGDPTASVEAALARVGAAALGGRRMDTLSGGERQRVHLARALAQLGEPGPPGVLLLDEPTSALDVAAQQHVMRVLTEVARGGHSVVVVLHDLNLAAAWADRLVVLAGGEVVADAVPGEALTPATLRAALGVEVHVVRHPDHGRPQVLVRA